jgi:hypothetical protein
VQPKDLARGRHGFGHAAAACVMAPLGGVVSGEEGSISWRWWGVGFAAPLSRVGGKRSGMG